MGQTNMEPQDGSLEGLVVSRASAICRAREFGLVLAWHFGNLHMKVQKADAGPCTSRS
jgi:hypothetical protein